MPNKQPILHCQVKVTVPDAQGNLPKIIANGIVNASGYIVQVAALVGGFHLTVHCWQNLLKTIWLVIGSIPLKEFGLAGGNLCL